MFLRHGFTLIFCMLIFAGCAKQESVSTGQEETETTPTRIAVIPKGTTHDFWQSVHAGSVKASQELGVEVIWKGPGREDDRELQIQVVDNFTATGVDGIVLAPLDNVALINPVRQAMAAGIPVAIIDSGLDAEPGEDYISFVASDNYRGGALAARRLAELVGEGKVLLLRYMEGSASTMERERGFLETLTAEFPEVEVISSDQYAGATADTAMSAGLRLLSQFEELDGIFCPNESSTFGMLRALAEDGRLGKVSFVGFDASPALVDALEKQEIHGLTVQNPFNMGYLGVKTVVAHLHGEPYEKEVDTGVTMVTPDNMTDPEVDSILHPDLETYLGN